MKILIIGAGAVGCGLAASFASEGLHTDVLARKNTAEYIRENGIVRNGIFKEIVIPAGQIGVYEQYGEVNGGYDFVAICAKTMSNATIAKSLADHRCILRDGGKIVIFQNGWGNDEEYLKYFDKSEVYNARVITGFERTAPGISKVTVHTAPVLLGSLFGCDNACMAPLANAINASGLPSEVSDEIEEALWAKMLFNTTLNPLGAILNLTYGGLSESEHLVNIMNSLIDETFAVIDAYGLKTYWKNGDEYRKVFYGKLVKDTYNHRSSTLQDITKKQKTEIDTLNGCVLKMAEAKKISVPTHRLICEMIKGIEDGYNE